MAKVHRKIISIDESKCDGCGLCIPACDEGALQIVDGKARLVKDIYCDGLGDCLGECPQGAITMIEREAEPFDEEAVEKHLEQLQQENDRESKKEKEEKDEKFARTIACSGSLEKEVDRSENKKEQVVSEEHVGELEAELSHWPIQIHLVNPEARFLQDQDLLIAADCVPFAFADFHRRFLAGHALLIGCPKLDDTSIYHGKLVEIFKKNKLNSITLALMEVPCCSGLSRLVRSAMQEADVSVPVKEIIIGVDGSIKEEIEQ